MPPAIIPAIALGVGAAGSAASASGGKKAANNANSIAQQQLALQQQQFALTQGLYNKGTAAFTPAFNYWNSLLQGGQAAVQATGPIASQIGQAGQGSRIGIMAGTPRGGEQNLALAESFNQQSNNIARLYAGMQPAAAQGLTQLAGTAFGAGAQVSPYANTFSAIQPSLLQMQQSTQAGTGFGNLLYQGIQKKANRPSAGGGGGANVGSFPSVFNLGTQLGAAV